MREIPALVDQKELKNNLIEINKAKSRLKDFENTTMGQTKQDEERALKYRIHALWKREELYWKQRSWVKWLTY